MGQYTNVVESGRFDDIIGIKSVYFLDKFCLFVELGVLVFYFEYGCYILYALFTLSILVLILLIYVLRILTYIFCPHLLLVTNFERKQSDTLEAGRLEESSPAMFILQCIPIDGNEWECHK